jgi:bacillithiol biosynthesis cysteine-adding enzyme BshC
VSAAGDGAHVPLERLPGIPSLARGLALGDPDVSPFLPDPPRLDAVLARAAALKSAPVVLTGQQAGIFTGPLLTLVKAVAARQLAGDLKARGANAEAVFWCASEDHDLVEVTRLPMPEPDGVRDLGPDPQTVAGNRCPVGGLPIEVDLGPYLEAVSAAAGTVEYGDLLGILRGLHEGRTYFEAFASTLRFLLDEPELRVFDPADPATKPSLVPLAVRLVREREDVRALLKLRAEGLLAAGHPLQVKTDPNALPLFARVEGDRLLLLEEAGKFSLKGDPQERAFTQDEVVSLFETGAWLPSFSALTRPLAASVLFPAAATLLGPAEVAYWAQMHPLFAWAGLLPPVLVLRPMAAPVDAQTRRLLLSTGLSVGDVLAGTEALLARRGRERAATPLAEMERFASRTDAELAALEPALLALDANLKRPLQATRQNVAFAIGKLAEKVTAAAGRADETLASKAARLSAAILPGGSLAERVTTPVPWLLRWGRDGLLRALEHDLRWDRPGLTVIEP